MRDILVLLATMGGGLGCFLLGMKHLSEGLQSVGGAGLKRFMSAMTTNRIAGLVTGVVSTVIVQSSSIITVMTVGFVSSGLMDLTQAINVIIGSNIGTTATAWLIAYAPDVRLMGFAAVTLGAILYFGFRREGVHNSGLAFLGLGLVFVGLYCMNVAIAPLKKSEAALKLFATLDAATLGGLLRCFAVSLVFTAIVQSSAATTAIAMTLANQGVITFEAAAATVFGMNIGTTVTAWLAAAGGSTEARRTAMAHTLFNVAGTIILMPLFIPVVLPSVKAFFPDWAAAPAAPMAAVHTGFNIVTTLCFLPFTAPFAAFVKRIVKERKSVAEIPRLVYLDAHMKMSPFICCSQAYQTMRFMAESVKDMMESVRAVLEGDAAPETEKHIFHREDILDRVQCEVTEFLGKVMSARLPVSVAEYARALLRIADEYESLSDEFPVIVKAYRRIRSDGAPWSADSRTAVLGILKDLDAFQERVLAAFLAGRHLRESVLAELSVTSKGLRHAIRAARESQLQRIGSAESAPLVALATLDIFNALDRARSCLINLAETLAGGKRTDRV